jgi:hypothetical protein
MGRWKRLPAIVAGSLFDGPVKVDLGNSLGFASLSFPEAKCLSEVLSYQAGQI